MLATFGVYGVIAFMVATRTREIGIRVALGASRGRVLRDVLVDALKLVVPGIALGLALAVLWVRLTDPVVLSARRRRAARLRDGRGDGVLGRRSGGHSIRAPRGGRAADDGDAGGVVSSPFARAG